MTEIIDLRSAALEIFAAALRSVDAQVAVRNHLNQQIREKRLDLGSRSVFAIALGKAAQPLAAGMSEVLGSSLTAGVLSGTHLSRYEDFVFGRWQQFAGGHPTPNEESLNAAKAAFALLDRANTEKALVFFLVSGGGSAMMEWPVVPTLSLAELQETNRQLVTSGASIAEINSVRAALSAVKRGGLAAAASHCDQITLIVSDTNPGDEKIVAAGPTFAAGADTIDPLQVIKDHRLDSTLPPSVISLLKSPVSKAAVEGKAETSAVVLLDNQTALDAAARAARKIGFTTEVAADIREQQIEFGCHKLVERFKQLIRNNPNQPVCLVSGGEFACPVRGSGVGGRNSETTLRLALAADAIDANEYVLLSAGTDGIDGNSPAAGAIATQDSLARANAADLDPRDFLASCDSHSLFQRLGDAIVTGPTGTNVRDLRILLAQPAKHGHLTLA